MENTNEINKKIAKNLSYYRKAANLTQAELAEKINYSDKSVSKWESGNGAPDVYILIQLAEMFGVTLNDLVSGETPVKTKKRGGGLHLLIMLLSSGIVWLVATFFFVSMVLWKPGYSWWLAFLYAVLANAIVLVVYASIWHYRFLNFLSTSVLIWISLTCLYLTISAVASQTGNDYSALWCVFLLGIPLQVLEVLWAFFRYLFKKRVKPQAQETAAQETKDGQE
ncbi:MAG: helix-turn-helix transcriptional regulator [Clostridia bacterium]|nr:helix-turn-helix transcriptional regulator [Clostridia bacterium]